MRTKNPLPLLPLLLFGTFGPAHGAGLEVSGLKCEYQTNPLGIDVPQPRLSWTLESPERGQVQTAYQVLVASSPGKLLAQQADVWDSGRITSSQSIQVEFAGKSLHSGQRVFWQVRVWDKDGRPSAPSRPACWEMGLLDKQDWHGTWISRKRPHPLTANELFDDDPAPLLRKEFLVSKKVRRARAYVSGLGYYELHLNGKRVGDHLLDPGWTTYSKRVLYSTYDVTGQLKRGSNAVGIRLGNGWYNPLPLPMFGQFNFREHLTIGEPRALLELVVEFTDGTTQRIVTDEAWKTAAGPLLRNNLYLGEVYDARKELPGWDRGGFDDSLWEPAIRADGGLGPLRAQQAPPIRLTRTFQPVKVTEPKPGIFIFDLGQNLAGWVRLGVKGPAGSRLRLRYGELLYPDGTLNGMTSVAGQIKGGGSAYQYDGKGMPKTAFQEDEYILKGAGEEFYVPHFTFHGFRYVEITSLGGPLSMSSRLFSDGNSQRERPGAGDGARITSLIGLRLNSDVASAGSFECSDELFNRIQRMVVLTELNNLFSVESDCPHREKLGYGGDILVASEMAMFNFDMAQFYSKAVEDLADAVRPNGGFTETAPYVGIASDGLGDGAGPIGWGSSHPVLAWELYQYYGDRRLLETQYDSVRRWIAFLKSRAQDGIVDNGISDHESLVPKPRALTGTAFYYLNTKVFARMARALGREADAAAAEQLAEHIKAAFNQRFLEPGTGRYDKATQASQAIPLYLDLVPAEEQGRALEVLLKDIEAHQGHLTTGIFGTKYMLNALSDLGRAEVAFQIASQRTFPGWGYMLEHGATTLWEHWEFSDNVYSHDHPMFGCVSEWFYKAVAGINPAPDAVGFDKVIIRPQPVGELQWAKGSYDSVRGKIISEWQRAGEQLKLHLRVPVSVTATVYLPAIAQAFVREGGRALADAKAVEFVEIQNGCAILRVGSGDFQFSSTLPPHKK